MNHLDALADQLIPGEDGMPSATEAGATGRWLDAVLAARPDLRAPLEGLAASTAGLTPEEAVAALPERDPAGWTALTSAVVAAYYFNPEVCERIGYQGQRALPLGPPDYEDLLDSVVGRGPVYRPTP
jgi:hypothetical protein